MAVFQGLSLCCIYYMFTLKLILKVFRFIIILNKAGLSWNIIRKSQRTFLSRYSEFCGSDSRGFAECSSSNDNEQKLDSRFGITLGLYKSAGFHCTPRLEDKEPTGNLLSPTTAGQSNVCCFSWEKTQNTIIPPCFLFCPVFVLALLVFKWSTFKYIVLKVTCSQIPGFQLENILKFLRFKSMLLLSYLLPLFVDRNGQQSVTTDQLV